MAQDGARGTAPPLAAEPDIGGPDGADLARLLKCYGREAINAALDRVKVPACSSPPHQPPATPTFDFVAPVSCASDPAGQPVDGGGLLDGIDPGIDLTELAAVELEGLGTPYIPSTYPASWEPCRQCALGLDGDGECTGRPLIDEADQVRCHLVPVDPEGAEGLAVTAPLRARGWEIVAVERVQNPRLLAEYQMGRDAELLLPWETNEFEGLFHTTRAADLDAVLLEGLDQRLSKPGRFGRGVYWADDPAKADRYWPRRRASETRVMLRGTVRLGRTKKFRPLVCDSSLLRAPRGYDSVCGNITGQNEYVVYENNRSLVEYAIHYTVGEGDAVNPA